MGLKSNIPVSPQSEFKQLENNFPGLRNKNKQRKFYINVEGFSSVKENTNENRFDSVLVITNFECGYNFDCSK
jgi:hypothetical protein